MLLPNPPKHPKLSLAPLHCPEDKGQLAFLRVQVLLGHGLVPSSEHPDVGDILLLDVPHWGDVVGVIQLQGAE